MTRNMLRVSPGARVPEGGRPGAAYVIRFLVACWTRPPGLEKPGTRRGSSLYAPNNFLTSSLAWFGRVGAFGGSGRRTYIASYG